MAIEDGPDIVVPVGSTHGENLRVKLVRVAGAPELKLAGIADGEHTLGTVLLAGDSETEVRMNHQAGSSEFVVTGAAIAAGDPVYTAASGKVSNTQGAGASLVGVAKSDQSGDIVEVYWLGSRCPPASAGTSGRPTGKVAQTAP